MNIAELTLTHRRGSVAARPSHHSCSLLFEPERVTAVTQPLPDAASRCLNYVFVCMAERGMRAVTLLFGTLLSSSGAFMLCPPRVHTKLSLVKARSSVAPRIITLLKKPELTSVAAERHREAGEETAAGDKDAPGLRRWDPQTWIQPAVWNKNIVRALALILAVGLASTTTRFGGRQAALFVHLMSYATWIGSLLWTTFVVGITLFKNLPRQTFGNVQAVLFPLYFQSSTLLLAVQLITLRALKLTTPTALAVSLVTTLMNLLFLEPNSTKIMKRRYSLENNGQRDSDEWRSLGKQFGKFHGLSSLFNLFALVGGFIHAWLLSSSLIF